MGMSVSAHLLKAAYPIAISGGALEKDLLELEKAGFLRPTEVPGTWLMTQVSRILQPPWIVRLVYTRRRSNTWSKKHCICRISAMI